MPSTEPPCCATSLLRPTSTAPCSSRSCFLPPYAIFSTEIASSYAILSTETAPARTGCAAVPGRKLGRSSGLSSYAAAYAAAWLPSPAGATTVLLLISQQIAVNSKQISVISRAILVSGSACVFCRCEVSRTCLLYTSDAADDM
eukprot:3408795-Rhodomonas_salina.2